MDGDYSERLSYYCCWCSLATALAASLDYTAAAVALRVVVVMVVTEIAATPYREELPS